MHDLVSKSRVMIRARSPLHPATEKKNKMFSGSKPQTKAKVNSNAFEFSNLVEREQLKDSRSQGCIQIQSFQNRRSLSQNGTIATQGTFVTTTNTTPKQSEAIFTEVNIKQKKRGWFFGRSKKNQQQLLSYQVEQSQIQDTFSSSKRNMEVYRTARDASIDLSQKGKGEINNGDSFCDLSSRQGGQGQMKVLREIPSPLDEKYKSIRVQKKGEGGGFNLMCGYCGYSKSRKFSQSPRFARPCKNTQVPK